MNIALRLWICAAAAVASMTASAGTLETTSSWDGSTNVYPFGESNTATYGQTFTVGSETVLDTFSFFVDDDDYVVGSDFVDFEAYVYAWDGAKASGSALFSSGPHSTTNNDGLGGFEKLEMETGGLTLATGAEYVAFFSASNLFDGVAGTSIWGYLGDVYDGGHFVYQNNGADFDALTTSAWTQRPGDDLAFEMEFSTTAAVPEPGTLGLIGAGLLGLGAMRRRRGV